MIGALSHTRLTLAGLKLANKVGEISPYEVNDYAVNELVQDAAEFITGKRSLTMQGAHCSLQDFAGPRAISALGSVVRLAALLVQNKDAWVAHGTGDVEVVDGNNSYTSTQRTSFLLNKKKLVAQFQFKQEFLAEKVNREVALLGFNLTASTEVPRAFFVLTTLRDVSNFFDFYNLCEDKKIKNILYSPTEYVNFGHHLRGDSHAFSSSDMSRYFYG